MSIFDCGFVWRRRLKGCIILLIALAISSCKSDPDKLFTRLNGSQTGITFINENVETPETNILTYEYFYNGGGVAAGDINNDGLTDLYFTSNQGENKLYLNEGNFRFKDITATSFTASPNGWKTGASMADINADGLLDIYVSRSGPHPPLERANSLFINNGDLTFKESGWRFGLNDQSYTTQTAFFDYDRDGDLDAFLLNHSLLSISYSYNINRQNELIRQPYVGNKLLRNDNGKFVDVSDSVGVFGPASNYGLGVSFSDLNNDGWTDLYAGCDYTGRDRLLLNRNGQSFSDATDSLLSHISKFTMGTDIADVNNDGFMDLYTVDMLPEGNYRQKQLQGSDRYDEYFAMVDNGLHHQCMRNMLHLNNGNGTFSEIGQQMKVSNTDWSWAALFADYDNDGVEDLFVSNGFKCDLTNNDFLKFQAFEEIKSGQKAGKKTAALDVIGKFGENKIANYIFKGNIDSAYANKSKEWGLDDPSLSNGAIYADLDNDGDLDIVTNNVNSEPGIYRNNSERSSSNHYLRIKLKAASKNTSAIGAKVTIYAGGKLQVRELFPVRGFQSSVEPILHFGLGTSSSVDSILIRWPDGSIQKEKGAVDKLIVIEQNSKASQSVNQQKSSLFQQVALNMPAHEENMFIDFRVQALLPRMYSHEGPAFAKADLNGDGISDFYLGGAAGKPGRFLIGSRNGSYSETNIDLMKSDKASEDVDALFFDADGDKDQDLYVVTGGYEISDSTVLLDKLYINSGNGNFKRTPLPPVAETGSCVRVADVDHDGDNDLFVGSRVVHGKYPASPESHLLINDGKGKFSLDEEFRKDFGSLGMITDAAWSDLNKDGQVDLILVGEWMAITPLINEKGKFHTDSKYIPRRTEGFWNCIVAHDFDKDGDDDFILGNQGTNSQMVASEGEPISVFYADYDKNGSVDPILNYYIQHKSYPYPSRDELAEQLPSFKKRFTNYDVYSKASIESILNADEMSRSNRLTAVVSSSSYLKNENGKLVLTPMPQQLQWAPLYAIGVLDIDRDGDDDIITGGNISSGRARTGRMTGNYGFVFVNDGKGNFSFVDPSHAGISVNGDIREIIIEDNRIYFALNAGRIHRFDLLK